MIDASLRGLRRVLCAGLLATVSGCSSLPSATSDTDLPLGPPVASFQISGRAMLRHEQRLDHFRFDWSHNERHDELLITSPFGQGLAQVMRTEAGATLRWPDGRTQQFADFPALANQLFGQPIPLEAVAQWLGGAYQEHSGNVDGWQVTVESSYRLTSPGPGVPNHVLPKALSFRQYETLLRLVIDDPEASP